VPRARCAAPRAVSRAARGRARGRRVSMHTRARAIREGDTRARYAPRSDARVWRARITQVCGDAAGAPGGARVARCWRGRDGHHRRGGGGLTHVTCVYSASVQFMRSVFRASLRRRRPAAWRTPATRARAPRPAWRATRGPSPASALSSHPLREHAPRQRSSREHSTQHARGNADAPGVPARSAGSSSGVDEIKS
jgi:hypothetical protein